MGGKRIIEQVRNF